MTDRLQAYLELERQVPPDGMVADTLLDEMDLAWYGLSDVDVRWLDGRPHTL